MPAWECKCEQIAIAGEEEAEPEQLDFLKSINVGE